MAKWLALIMVGILSGLAQAQNQRHLQIQSKFDQFELVLSGASGTINGKTADLSTFNELLPMLTNTLDSECAQPKTKADVTVREAGKTRYLYIAQGVVSDGNNCLNVGGDGLYYFPVHRDFLIGPKRDGIAVNSPLKIFRQGVKVVEIKKVGSSWTAESGDILPNWDFLERLLGSLNQFDVRFHVSLEMGKDKAKVIIQSGDKSYEFYKLTQVLWGVKKPGAKWLEASDDWSFWYDLDDGVLTDRFAPQIHLAQDTSKDLPTRLAAIDKLKDAWSRNLRDLFHHIILNDAEGPQIKAVALKRLRGHPSHETAGVMTQFLAQSSDEDSKRIAGQILKIIEPKGPQYDPSAPAEERAKVVEYWSHWWTKNQNAH